MASVHRLLALSSLLFLSAALQAQTARYSGAQITLPSDATYPYGVAVDSSGNVWVVDNLSGGVSEVTPSGAAYLAVNGNEVISGLNGPYGIAVDTHGNLYITEEGGGDVLKETLVPTAYGNTYTASVLPVSGLSTPYGIAVDAGGNVYIADIFHNRVLKETPSGSSYTQSTLPTSTLSQPQGVAVDAGGSVYIADLGHNRVVKETPSVSGYSESTVVDQLANTPIGVAVDGTGSVYVLAYGLGGYAEDYFIVKETPSQNGYTQSPVSFGPVQNPYGIAVDTGGDVFICSPGNTRLQELKPGAGDFGPVPVGGSPLAISLIFTMETAGTLGHPAVLTEGAPGLSFVEAGSGECTGADGRAYAAGDACSIDVLFQPRQAAAFDGAGVLQDAAGNALASAYIYGTGVAPQISFLPTTRLPIDSGLANPSGLAVDGNGNVLVVEAGNGVLAKETRSGNSFQRSVMASGWTQAAAVAVDGRGSLYVAAAGTIYKETPALSGYLPSSIVNSPTALAGIALDGSGNLYFTALASGDVHKETLQADGSYAESAIGFGITRPAGIALDGLGDLFVTDPQQGDVYQETLTANGSYRQTMIASALADPEQVAVDGGGNVYVLSFASGQIWKEAPQANGTYLQTVMADGLTNPRGLALDASGNLYVSLGETGEVVMIDVADPPVLRFARTSVGSTSVGSTSADSPQTLTVANIGNGPLHFPLPAEGSNPTLTAGFSLASATTCPLTGGTLAAGSTCVYAVDFVPQTAGPIRGSLDLLDSNLNGYARQSIELREGLTSDATRTTVRLGPDQIKLGLGVTITATVTDTSMLSVTPQGGGVTFTDTLNGTATALNGEAPVPLVGGKAILTIAPRLAGEHLITAHYVGLDASFAGSTGSAPLSVFH